VWGVWLDDSLQLSVGSPTVWRALQSSSDASAHLEDGHDVVVVEGSWRQSEANDELTRFCDVYNEKYRWDMRPDALPGPVLVLEPRHVLAFRAGRWQDAKRDPFPLAASKFTF
jgi:hypothetical protein